MTITTVNNIVSSGVAAARPATPALATPASGSNPSVIYFATDTLVGSMWDFAGAAWHNISGGGSGTVTSVSLSAPLGGGTVTTTGTLGTTSYTAHGVLIGAGSSALTVSAVGAANTFLAGVASADPVFRSFVAASADLANQGTTTTVLHGNAAGNPSWAAVTLTTDVTGTLPVGNGGIGVATLAAHGVLIGNTASAVNVTSAGTAGQVLTSNGASADPTFQAPAGGSTSPTGAAYSVPTLATFSWVNQGSSTVVQAVSGQAILLTIPSNASLNWRLQAITAPSTPYTITAQIYGGTTIQAASNSSLCGLYFYDGTKLYGIEYLNQGAGYNIRVEKITNVTTDGSTPAGPNGTGFQNAFLYPQWLRVKDDGTNLVFSYSADGQNFIQLFSEAVGTYMTPTKVGFGGLSNVGAINLDVNLLNWLQT